MEGFLTADGHNTPSALANGQIFGMLFLACGRAWSSKGLTRPRLGRRETDGFFVLSSSILDP